MWRAQKGTYYTIDIHSLTLLNSHDFLQHSQSFFHPFRRAVCSEVTMGFDLRGKYYDIYTYIYTHGTVIVTFAFQTSCLP